MLQPTTLEPLLEPREVARILRISQRSLDKLIRSRQIAVTKVGNLNHFTWGAVLQYIVTHTVMADDGGAAVLADRLASEAIQTMWGQVKGLVEEAVRAELNSRDVRAGLARREAA